MNSLDQWPQLKMWVLFCIFLLAATPLFTELAFLASRDLAYCFSSSFQLVGRRAVAFSLRPLASSVWGGDAYSLHRRPAAAVQVNTATTHLHASLWASVNFLAAMSCLPLMLIWVFISVNNTRCVMPQAVKDSWENLWKTCVRSLARIRKWKTTSRSLGKRPRSWRSLTHCSKPAGNMWERSPIFQSWSWILSVRQDLSSALPVSFN